MTVPLPAYSLDSLYSLGFENQPGSHSVADSGQSTELILTVHLDHAEITNLRADVEVNVPLPGGKNIKGRVISLIDNPELSRQSASALKSVRKIISLDNGAGSVELDITGDAVTKMLLHDVANAQIYLASIDMNGAGHLRLQDNNDYYCVRFPETGLPVASVQPIPRAAEAIPSITTLRNLQNRPGSANVLFIDYWGGSLSNTAWNANYTSNNPINYTAYDTDGNPGSFSSEERYSMWLAWREAVEDYAAFNINITTSPTVYNTAAVTNRLRIIVTTTSSWYGSSGGVAYVNVFGLNSDYYKVGWAWNLTNRSMGMTISHEAGHQMGLGHDGENGSSYYSGHGVWGPIMGAPFGKPYVQWSKGEYPGANRFENDTAIISSKLGSIADEAGNGFTGATPLGLPVNNRAGLIGYNDSDAYKFTLSSSSSVNIEVIPLLGDENEPRASNLSMNVSLVRLNAGGNIITTLNSIKASDNVPLSPLTNLMAFSGTLGEGIYGLRITPASPDPNWATGFGSYGIAGEYRFTVNAAPQNAPDLVVQHADVNDSTLTPGQNFNISATVLNRGQAAATGTLLRYYRSGDSTITPSDVQVSADSVPALAANGSSAQNTTVPAPNAAGNYWIGACADPVSNESDTQNNCSAAVKITVAAATSPDLVVTTIGISNSSLMPYQDFGVSARVLNQGAAPSDTTDLRYFMSADSLISRSDTELGSVGINGLNPGSTSMQNGQFAAPAAPGTYWVGACVDSVLNESNTNNNCSDGSQFEVATGVVTPADKCTTFVITGQNNKLHTFCL